MHIVIHNPIAETASELEVGESVLIDMNILTKANNMVVGTSIRPAFLGRIMKLIWKNYNNSFFNQLQLF